MKTPLTLVYLLCFGLCGWPSIIRMVRRRSSQDLSVWREWLLMLGVAAQFGVMMLDGVSWQVWVSPINTAVSVGTTLGVIYWYRQEGGHSTDGPQNPSTTTD